MTPQAASTCTNCGGGFPASKNHSHAHEYRSLDSLCTTCRARKNRGKRQTRRLATRDRRSGFRMKVAAGRGNVLLLSGGASGGGRLIATVASRLVTAIRRRARH